MSKKHRVAVYGTLRRGMGNDRLLDDATFIGTDTLKDYGMVSLGGFPAIDEREGSDAVVEVYLVDDKQLHRLDMLEGCDGNDPCDNPDNFYSRQEVTLSSGTTAWVYFIPGILEDYQGDSVLEGDWRAFMENHYVGRSQMRG